MISLPIDRRVNCETALGGCFLSRLGHCDALRMLSQNIFFIYKNILFVLRFTFSSDTPSDIGFSVLSELVSSSMPCEEDEKRSRGASNYKCTGDAFVLEKEPNSTGHSNCASSIQCS
jgi:hypothetical protein